MGSEHGCCSTQRKGASILEDTGQRVSLHTECNEGNPGVVQSKALGVIKDRNQGF